jgi:steroid delta-isomerase-like uncharacterized protein
MRRQAPQSVRTEEELETKEQSPAAALRLKNIDDHVAGENKRDVDRATAVCSSDPEWIDMATGEHSKGQEAVKAHYRELFTALPDLSIEVVSRFVAADAIFEQVIVRGTHQGPWKGIPATNKKVEFPLCSVYTFDRDNMLKTEQSYYDELTILKQVGLASTTTAGDIYTRLRTGAS